MKPYAKLRGRLTECGYTQLDLANFVGKSPSYVSERMAGKRYDWEISEAYLILDRLDVPTNEIFNYFPPNKGKGCETNG